MLHRAVVIHRDVIKLADGVGGLACDLIRINVNVRVNDHSKTVSLFSVAEYYICYHFFRPNARKIRRLSRRTLRAIIYWRRIRGRTGFDGGFEARQASSGAGPL